VTQETTETPAGNLTDRQLIEQTYYRTGEMIALFNRYRPLLDRYEKLMKNPVADYLANRPAKREARHG
jgi:hypothetical protein